MIPGVPRPCVTCGTLSTWGSSCQPCSTERERKRHKARGQRHYTGDYKRRAREVRANATECWICHKGQNPNDPWTADHLIPGDPNSPLAPAHRSCNSKRGNKTISETQTG